GARHQQATAVRRPARRTRVRRGVLDALERPRARIEQHEDGAAPAQPALEPGRAAEQPIEGLEGRRALRAAAGRALPEVADRRVGELRAVHSARPGAAEQQRRRDRRRAPHHRPCTTGRPTKPGDPSGPAGPSRTNSAWSTTLPPTTDTTRCAASGNGKSGCSANSWSSSEKYAPQPTCEWYTHVMRSPRCSASSSARR